MEKPEFLKKLKTVNFTFDDVLNDYKSDTNRTAERLAFWEEQGWIRPVRKKTVIPRAPYCPQHYRLVRERKEQPVTYSKEEMLQIMGLHPSLRAYYGEHPKEYFKYEKDICRLSDWLYRKDTDGAPVTVRERSFEIFGREKALESSVKPGEEHTGYLIMQHCGLSYKDLACYRNVKPFSFERIDEGAYGLILENMDPWTSLAKAFREAGSNLLFGHRIKYLVFGDGNRITRGGNGQDGGTFLDFAEIAGIHDVIWLYAGDIDRKGFWMAEQFMERNRMEEGGLFIELYEAVLDKYTHMDCPVQPSGDHSSACYEGMLLNGFEESAKNMLADALENNLRIPQEVLNQNDYRKLIMESREATLG